MVELYELTYTLIAIFASWSMYATLYGKPSPFRSWAESSFIGISMGLQCLTTALYIWRTGWEPFAKGNWMPAVGILLGLVMVARLFPKYSYIARAPIAISLGANLAISLRTTIFTGFISQIQATIVPFYIAGNMYQSAINTVTSISVFLMLTFFLYSTELKGPLKYTSRLGEYSLYIALGAVFAQTFMGRLGLLTGYMQTIFDPAWKVPYGLGFAVIVLAGVFILDRYHLLEKLSD